MAGLQLQEAQRLTWDRIDFRQGTVRIDGLVKNAYRLRLIPIPQVVLWLLRRRRESVCGQEESLFSYRTCSHYSKAVKKALRAYADQALAGEDDVLSGKFRSLPPKDLRNTIQTAATEGGWFGYYLQRYFGHAPTITGGRQTTGVRHYWGNQWRRIWPHLIEVRDRIQKEIDGWTPAVEPSILPGPRLAAEVR